MLWEIKEQGLSQRIEKGQGKEEAGGGFKISIEVQDNSVTCENALALLMSLRILSVCYSNTLLLCMVIFELWEPSACRKNNNKTHFMMGFKVREHFIYCLYVLDGLSVFWSN